MKAILLIFLVPLFLLWNGFASAQSVPPNLSGFTYQAALRNGTGDPLKLQFVSFRFSILSGSPTGTPVYVEHVTDQTNQQGLFNTVIGKNTSELGDFSSIDWSQGNYYLKAEVDPQGNSNFSDLGTMPFNAVPFAFYALKAGNAATGGDGPGGPGTPGQTGSKGVGITWLGTFSSIPGGASVNYAYYNSADKKSYVYDSTGTWQILAQDGLDGVNGADGAPGISITWLGTYQTVPDSAKLNQAYYNATDRKSYIWDGSKWEVLAEDGIGWNLKVLAFAPTGQLILTSTDNGGDSLKTVKKAAMLGGNLNVDPNVDFLGTLDTAALVFKTGGAGNSNERMRINGQTPAVLINGTVDTAFTQSLGVLTVFSGNAPGRINSDGLLTNAINGYASNGTTTIYGRNYSTGAGVKGMSDGGPGIWGYANSRLAQPVKGEQFSSNGGFGVVGTTLSPIISAAGPGAGIVGASTATNGVGVLGLGNGVPYQSFATAPLVGAGIIGGGKNMGAYMVGTNANGIGLAGGGNGQLPMLPANGAGVAGTSYYVGVAGFAKNGGNAVDRWGGYFEYRNSSSLSDAPIAYGYVAGLTAADNVVHGIAFSGAKSTIIKDDNNNPRLLYCPEAPEILFQDYGTGELENGSAHIDLERLMTKSIRVDKEHPMKVFIQLEGDCAGVYVTNKSAKGFDVKELQHGTSNVPFSWQIIASRADEMDSEGKTIPYSDQRFGTAPGPLPSVDANDTAALFANRDRGELATLQPEEKDIINAAFSNLQFATAQAEIATSSYTSLNKMAGLLQAHADWTLKLSGHTDNEGSAAFNQLLSEKRSEAVKQYLVNKGIAANRITTIGYGQSRPLSTNNTREAREKNRRVEIEVFTEKP